MKNPFKYLLVFIGFLLLIGCTPREVTQVNPTMSDTYPADEEMAYPITPPMIETDMGYPISEAESPYPQGPEFTIDVPVKGGTVTVTGTGPANVPIRLVNVSEIGLILGNTTITPDGSFVFSLEEPLISGHMIGLQLGDISNTIFNEEDFLYSETYFERPLIGIMFDMAIVE